MTKVIIVGDMTFGESTPPPGVTPPIAGPAPGRPSQPIELPPGVDNGLPPIPGQGLPPPDLGPGEIWPPLPPGPKPTGKAYAIVAVPGVGYRYTVIDLGLRPDQGLPGGRPVRPDQGLPPHPEHKPVEPDEPEPEPHNRRR